MYYIVECRECGKIFVNHQCSCGGGVFDLAATKKEYDDIIVKEESIDKQQAIRKKFLKEEE